MNELSLNFDQDPAGSGAQPQINGRGLGAHTTFLLRSACGVRYIPGYNQSQIVSESKKGKYLY